MSLGVPTLSAGTLLGGRVQYDQPRDGYRTGIEPVLLAASVPARPGARVIEAGTGAGAALVCLVARVTGVEGVGLEYDPDMAAVARANLAANGCTTVSVDTQDVTTWRPASAYDHAFANPPWHDSYSTRSPVRGRDTAKTAERGLLNIWCTALARGLKRRGTLTLILPAASTSHGMAALTAAACAELAVFPLWPRQGQPAKLVILQGTREGAGPTRLLPGLILHDPDGSYTEDADRVLRDGAALTI